MTTDLRNAIQKRAAEVVTSTAIEELTADADMTPATDVELEFMGRHYRGQISGYSPSALTLSIRGEDGNFAGQQQMALSEVTNLRRATS